jgi:hypothetical protein
MWTARIIRMQDGTLDVVLSRWTRSQRYPVDLITLRLSDRAETELGMIVRCLGEVVRAADDRRRNGDAG